MSPRYDGYYRSYFVKHEDWHAGVHMVDHLVHYLQLYENGLWLRKLHTTLDLDFAAYTSSITDVDFQEGLAGRHPLDKGYSFAHQTGRFTQRENWLAFEMAIEIGQLDIWRWQARFDSPEILQSSYGATYFFQQAG